MRAGDFSRYGRIGYTDRAAIEAVDARLSAYHRVGYDDRPMLFRGGGTFAVGGARCERYWTTRDGGR